MQHDNKLLECRIPTTSSDIGIAQMTGVQEGEPVWTVQAPNEPNIPKFKKTAKSPKALNFNGNGPQV